jgi:hypothetical protein
MLFSERNEMWSEYALVHTQELVCTPESAVQVCYTYTTLDHADYPVQVRPMPGIWVQSVAVTAIP